MTAPSLAMASVSASGAFERALRAAGLATAVEVAGGLAILRIDACDFERIAEKRADIVELATAHGFTHVAVEI